EGVAVERVVLRHREADVGAADLFERHEDRGAVEYPLHVAPALARLAERFGIGVLEDDVGMAARGIERRALSALYASALEIDDAKLQAALAVRRLRQHHRIVGDRTIDHRHLLAVDLATLESGADGLGQHRARPLCTGEGTDQIASSDLG